MLVAVFRAQADGERTAARLRDRGHEAVLAPVFDIVPTGERVPDGAFAGVIFTSAHGAETLSAEDARRLSSSLAFCVGDRTAEQAQAAGFTRIRSARADAERLAALVAADLPAGSRLLLVAGRDRKPVIEERVAAAGFEIAVAEVYEARGRQRWPEAVCTVLAGMAVAAALHYSRRSATLALDCAVAADLSSRFAAWRHHCLSEDAAGPLRAAGVSGIVVAAEPNETSLLGTLRQDADARDLRGRGSLDQNRP